MRRLANTGLSTAAHAALAQELRQSIPRASADHRLSPSLKIVHRLLAAFATAMAATAAGLAPASQIAGESPVDRAGTAGVTVALPSGWRFFGAAVAPASMPYADPLVRVVASSEPVRLDLKGCKAETFRFAPRQVGLMIVEWVRPQPGVVWRPKPAHFTAKALPVRPPPAVECWPGPGGTVQFALNGRHLGAYLLVMRGAPLRLVAQARSVLDTLRVTRRH